MSNCWGHHPSPPSRGKGPSKNFSVSLWPSRPPTGYSSARTTDSPQSGRQGTESCIIFIFFIESSQCWAHSYCPQIVITVNLQLLRGLFQPSLLTGALSPGLAGPRPTAPRASRQSETFDSNLPYEDLSVPGEPRCHEFIIHLLPRYMYEHFIRCIIPHGHCREDIMPPPSAEAEGGVGKGLPLVPSCELKKGPL